MKNFFILLFAFVFGTDMALGNSYGIAVNGMMFYEGTEILNPIDPSFQEFAVLGLSLNAGDQFQLCYFNSNENNYSYWVIDPDNASTAGVQRDNDYFVCRHTGCYDIYMKLKYENDQIYIGSGECASLSGILISPKIYYITKISDLEQGYISGASQAMVFEKIELEAIANYGYHFVKWNDGDTSNPRTIKLTQDTTFIAKFAKNTYSVTTESSNLEYGTTSGGGAALYLDQLQISATPDYGYHFTQWSDGNTDNPRTIVLTQDTTFTAEFAKNTCSIVTLSSNSEWGTATGGGSALYLDQLQIFATTNYGYHFAKWNDGNMENPRLVTVTGNATYTAKFEKNTYYIDAISGASTMGSVSAPSSAKYLDEIKLTAIPNYGYHFTEWNDGVKDNPRYLILTQDTVLFAEFATDVTGTCGKNYALFWAYNATSKSLTISGNGTFDEHMECGVEAKQNMTNLIIDEGVTSIGERAFSDCSNLSTVQLPTSLKIIGERAFSNCLDLTSIYNYRENPCLLETSTFEKVNTFDCKLYVLANSVSKYRSEASGWKIFYEILPIGATETTVGDDVIAEPQDNVVTLTWPINSNATSYVIEITKDGVVFCRLIFDANGQLTGIAFAPNREGYSQTPAAIMVANGLQFTVTGLNSGTNYGYSVTAKDSNDQPIASYNGAFKTTNVATSLDQITNHQSPITNKIIKDNQLFILRGDRIYTITGQEVK